MIIDHYLIVVLSAVGFQTSVKSFSIVPSIPSSSIKVIALPSTTRLYATTGQTTINRSNSKSSEDFWGSPRSSEEIVHFVSDAIFDNNMRGGDNYDSSQVVNEKQWVEVISAEPPVSRSDSSRKYNTLSLLKQTVAPISYNTLIYIYIYIATSCAWIPRTLILRSNRRCYTWWVLF
jgi:hypothetical protein